MVYQFNKFDPLLKTCKKIGNFYVLAFEGDIYKWEYEEIFNRKRLRYMITNSIKFRQGESDRNLKATIWTFDSEAEHFTKKCVYRNTIGVYFKGNINGSSTKHYILKEEVPEMMNKDE